MVVVKEKKKRIYRKWTPQRRVEMLAEVQQLINNGADPEITLIDTEQTAALTGMTPGSIRTQRSAGDFPFSPVYIKHRVRFRLVDVLKAISGEMMPSS